MRRKYLVALTLLAGLLGSCEASREAIQAPIPEVYPNFEEKLEQRDNRLDSLRTKSAPAEF